MSNNPLISFCLLSYNQEKYIEEAIKGAFMQSYSPLEIIISDDCSSDRTKSIIQELAEKYKGEHMLKINFNEVNIGLAAHFNDVILNQARGEYIIIAAGDDISYPDRTLISYNFIKNKENTYIVDFDVNHIDSKGLVLEKPQNKKTGYSNLNDYIKGNKILSSGCSRIYKRELFNIFGPLGSNCPTEDSTSIFRALILGNLWFCDEKVVAYRIHESNLSGQNNILKMNLNAIFMQYVRDLIMAFKLELVSFNQGVRVTKALFLRYYKRIRKNAILRKKLKLNNNCSSV